jgi:hypothetical protein
MTDRNADVEHDERDEEPIDELEQVYSFERRYVSLQYFVAAD